MIKEYAIGAICTGHNILPDEYNGLECEILGGLEMRGWWNEETGEPGESLCYHVRWATGEETHQEHHELRKKEPPAANTGEMRIKEMFTKPPVVVPVDRPIPELA